MDEDDDFGELYSDILLPSSATSSPPPPPPQIRRPIDLNTIDNDDEDTIYPPPNSDIKPIINNNNSNNSELRGSGLGGKVEALGEKGKLDLGARVLEKKEKGFGGGLSMLDEDIDIVVEERDDKDGDFVVKDDDLVGKIEIRGSLEGFGGSTMIPGVSAMSGFSSGERRGSLGGQSGNLDGNSVRKNGIGENLGGGSGNFEGFGGSAVIPGVSSMGGFSSGLQGAEHRNLNFDEESDSDSDDLQIVLNNDNEMGVMGMERMGGGEDDDGDNLVILAADDTLGNSGMMENSEWGDEAGIGADGERKELGDASKVNGGVAVHPKVPYGNHGFHHPFHSQFKVSDVAHLGCPI